MRGLPDHSLIDRLVRGRAWIPVLGVLLVGIVAMQVEILKLGASTGRAVEQTATLQTQNQALQENVATLADDQRIERIAASQGMVMPSAESLVFLTARPGAQVGRALGNIQMPNASAFTSELAAQAAAAAALMPATSTASSTSTAGATSTSGTTATSAGSSTIPATSSAPATSQTTTATSVTPAAPATGTATSAPTATSPASGTTVAPGTGVPATTAAGASGAGALAPAQSSGG